MGWVKDALKQLDMGHDVKIRPFGGSMRGRIESGQLVTLTPVPPAEVEVHDVVLVRWKGNYLLHIVKKIDGERIQIGNNIGKINGWTRLSAVRGKVIAVED